MPVNFHSLVEDLVRHGETLEHAIERAAYREAHPGHDLEDDRAEHIGVFEGET